MLAVAEAQARVQGAFGPTPLEWVTLERALGRVLACDLCARRDQPPVAVSAMDGYAVRAADTADGTERLRLVGEVAAGGAAAPAVGPGEAVRIFTGGALPAGADAILIQENAEAGDGLVRCLAATEPGRFVRPAGLDFARGWRGLEAGRTLDPLALGLAAAMGHLWLPVRRQPRIGLLATGDELVWPGETPGPHAIVSSNSTVLAGLVAAWGGEPVDLGIARDDAASLAAALDQVRGLDALVTTGGASVGDHDLVREALGGRGLELDFWQIAMRPGKPLIFGRLGAVPVLGLPGNPVSTAVCAIVFLRGALRRALGRDPALPLSEARLAAPLAPNDHRQDHLRARLLPGDGGPPRVLPAGRQDSSMFATLALADALLVRPPHDPALAEGHPVRIIGLAEVLRRDL
ncbi:MAG TPA: gephyrin-like molybdotransferase Glp [Geminicoccaceae bacterium]|nr:gephyrin-like molybdotransferase Glp [Geminicoccaceae bacterium]